MPGFDVYLLACELSAAFRLGNMKRDGVAKIIARFQNDAPLGLQALFHVPTAELAKRFGRSHGQRLYDAEDLQRRWAKLWIQEEMNRK